MDLSVLRRILSKLSYCSNVVGFIDHLKVSQTFCHLQPTNINITIPILDFKETERPGYILHAVRSAGV